jgi:RNA polymerase sigma-70 factor (ECF subfamily)
MATSEHFEAILSAARTGADWAVAELYRAHHPKLARYLRAQAPTEWADLAADTWLDAARGLTGFHGDADAFAGWLFTIGRRRLIDHRRAMGRRPVRPVAPHELATATVPSAEHEAFSSGDLADEAALRIVALLPEDQAEIVLLRVVAGLDVAAVAAITGKRPGAVRVAQHRALRRLAQVLSPTGNGEEVPDDGTERDAPAPTPPR